MLLYREVRKSWGLVAPFYAELLRWAARIHEIGLTISHSQYHKHGAYLLEYSDLPGFSKQVQKALAVLVRCHRRKISPLVFEGYSEEELEPLLRLCVLLRLAVILQHGRVGEIPESLKLRAEKRNVDIHFDEQWLQAHPLTLADLAAEAEYLLKMGVTLQINPQTSNTPS
jgi:exopolyphosphatase/guanosine-5'-triphosphate,3'-diphosphate pyrophosphatase